MERRGEVNIYEELFQGFIITKNKKSIEKIKGRNDFKTFNQVKDEPEFAGVLKENIALIDIDNTEMSDLLFKIVQDKKINCVVIKTGRGKHFLFKNNSITANKTKCKLAISLEADIKLGIKASYEVLKADGNLREVLLNPDELDEIPKWLIPISANIEFINMEAGDGRNQALFNYILTLQSADFTIEEARECIRIINQYILKESLSEKELETILRDEAFQKPVFFKGTTFLFDKFANYLKNNEHIIRINNQFHIYKDGIYVSNEKLIYNAMLKHIPNLNRAKRNEVMAYLEDLIIENIPASSANLIAFKNGVYNLVDDTFMDFSPNYIITNKINWCYNPEAYSELVDKTLNKIACHDKEIRMLLEEIVGACMYRSNTLSGGKAFILIGEKNNGKSTFLDMVKTMLGDENIASLDLGELGDRFKTAELFGKLANIGDDIGDEFISNSSFFKKLVTGDRVNAERKGQDPFEFENYAKMLFSANNIPRMGKGRDTGAIIRRLVIIPFNARFSDADPDYKPGIKYELREQECMEYLIQLGIQGLKRVIKNKAYTKSQKVEKELEEYAERNNPILSFLQYCEDEDIQIENEPVSKIYEEYQRYCDKNGYTALANNEFSKQLQRQTELTTTRKTINGRKYTIFIKPENGQAGQAQDKHK